MNEDLVKAYLKAAKAHSEARKHYAEEFVLSYARDANSFVATQVATDRTGDKVTLTAAALKVAELRMERDDESAP